MIIIHALNLRDTKRSLTNVSSIPALLNQILLAMGNGNDENDEKTWPLTTISSLTLTILHSLTFFHGPAGGLFFFSLNANVIREKGDHPVRMRHTSRV